ncbi:hypothetical protein HHL21_19720 [Massilia sp. RP-1-19]|uniref:Transmembrane protein n=1 Tax=Massilia polaris TaxID=2728846 RepID=A0A848HQ80_9BURK|nr:hypothetical protein [Massilia polaris]NML63274.1 hypothetical protein [Massilia polaris]
MRKSLLSSLVLPVLAALVLAGCSPAYNWRDYNSPDAPYQAMFPDKPVSHKRSINLDGLTVDMTMTAAEIDGTVFAIGSAEAPDAAQAQAAVAAMRTAMIKNIGATVTREEKKDAAIHIDAKGMQNGAPMRLVGHFESRGTRFYQVIVMGKENNVPQDEVDMFMSSFKLN